eukprot:COSAG04_NODE_17296_length_473_cov_0.791444_1_plen_138_part_10
MPRRGGRQTGARLVPWVGMLLRCAHDCALAKLEEERAHHAAEPPPPSPGKRPDAVAQLEDNLQRSAALPQQARFWGVNAAVQSSSDWAAPAAVLSRLQKVSVMLGAAQASDGTTAMSDGVEMADAEAALPTSLFRVLV